MATELDTEQQTRLSFLEEAETYFKEIETVILTLGASEHQPQQVDLAMRAAHSVKGAAGMMGFTILSQVAHRMEDCFKILRVRNLTLEPAVETLLLEGLDCLRTIRQHYYDQQEIEDTWLEIHIDLVFDKLREHLGELTEADETQLLAGEEGVDAALLAFTTEVESSLERLEHFLPSLTGQPLHQAVLTEAAQLLASGQKAQIDTFVALCQSVLDQCRLVQANPDQIKELAERSMTAWRRSLSLVQLGRHSQLPKAIAPIVTTSPAPSVPVAAPISTLSTPKQQAPELSLEASDIVPQRATSSPNGTAPKPANGDRPSQKTTSPDTQAHPVSKTNDTAATATNTANYDTHSQPIAPVATSRVPVVYLQSINKLIGSLLLDRNAIKLRLDQLQTFAGLLRDRVKAIEDFNIQVRQWYDTSSMDAVNIAGDVPAKTSAQNGLGQNQQASSGTKPNRLLRPRSLSGDNLPDAGIGRSAEVEHLLAEFDALEMDQYSELHLLARDQMETIVKLQEVAADVELGLQELGQSVESLNLTGQSLQKQVNLAQMRPFEDIVGRFPRLIRDLAAEYDKQVKIEINGQSILFERYALEMLTDPLMHLVRNAFDHGIEDPLTRQNNGKPLEGTIQIEATNRGNKAVIIVSDDGRGVNLAKIRDRAYAHGIASDRIQQMDRQELLNLIFEPGFSTAEQLTELSGRGVGMDVVRANLSTINGEIQLETEWGKGTTFTISIPLSLSLLRVVLLEQANMVFALPAGDVQEMITVNPDHIISNKHQEVIIWRESAIPLIRVEEHWPINNKSVRPMQLNGNPLIDRPLVVIVGVKQQSYALTIDRFWQEEEVAIRPLSSSLPLPPGFNGTTLSGDGRVIPLVDPLQLLTWVNARIQKLLIPPTASTSPTQAVDNRTVLVVDDSIHARRYLVLTLTKAGYAAEQAKDGHEAVSLLKSGLQVQAVICDVEMPRMDGYGVLDAIKSDPALASLPVIMLTSRSSEKHRKLAMNLGASAYFSKPYNEQQLLQT